MTIAHDPEQQASYLHQVLAQHQRPLGIVLGAGCPVSIPAPAGGGPLIPAVQALTTEVIATLTANAKVKPLITRLKENFAEDGHPGPNVEDFLTHVRGLKAIAGTQSVRSFSVVDITQLDDAISKTIVERVRRELPSDSTAYHSLAMWIGAASREHAVELFTTNYDLLMEQALERQYVPYFDGFVGAHRPFFDSFAMEEDKLPPRWARVWKLHGSINWRLDSGTLRVSRSEAPDDGGFVIHPSHLKYEESRRMPYLAMLDRLRAFLKQRDAALVICGYSFNDQHLNEILRSAMPANPSAVVFGLMHGTMAQYTLGLELAKSCPNIALLASDSAVVGGRQAPWTPKRLPEEGAPVPIAFKSQTLAAGDPKPALFLLGDFAVFGQFIDDLIRERRVPPEEHDAA